MSKKLLGSRVASIKSEKNKYFDNLIQSVTAIKLDRNVTLEQKVDDVRTRSAPWKSQLGGEAF